MLPTQESEVEHNLPLTTATEKLHTTGLTKTTREVIKAHLTEQQHQLRESTTGMHLCKLRYLGHAHGNLTLPPTPRGVQLPGTSHPDNEEHASRTPQNKKPSQGKSTHQSLRMPSSGQINRCCRIHPETSCTYQPNQSRTRNHHHCNNQNEPISSSQKGSHHTAILNSDQPSTVTINSQAAC